MDGKCDEVREAGARSGKDLPTIVKSLDFTVITTGSHWKASHLSSHHLDMTSLFHSKRQRGRRNN